MRTNVLTYLEESAQKYPDKIVYADENESITYDSLVNVAGTIATNLLKLSDTDRRPVFVFVDRNIKSVISFFGIVYSGNFYVPVDKDLPIERIKSMIESMHPAALIYQESQKELAESLDGVKVLAYEELLQGENDSEALAQIRNRHLDTNPLYAIFTSGSTGVPKAVLICHHSVIDLVDNFVSEFGFDENSVFGNQAPFDFDVSVKDIYSTIASAGTMQIVPKKLFMVPVRLVAYLNDKKINTIIWAVSALVILANFKTFQKCKPEYLKRVMFSGEVMPVKVLNYWRENVEAEYVNLYGPTEITCNCTFYKINKDFKEDEIIPIGKAFQNTGILLLDEKREKEVAKGETGEICVTGSSLALGYYNNPEKTNEVFIQNPLSKEYRDIIYCTGDLGRYDESGNLIFASRKDHQIKHMGHRIELGEIEASVNAMSFIDNAVCIYVKEKNQIVLCYQAENECKNEIIAQLSKKLPKYMWPTVYNHYDKLPMSSHAKVDRVRLGQMIHEKL